VPVGRSGGRVPDARAAVDAGGTAVPGPERLPDVRQHGRIGHQRAHVPAQGLHGGGQRRPDVRHAGRGPVRVYQLRWPRPVQAAPVPGHAVRHPPYVRRPQLRHAVRVGAHTVVHGVRVRRYAHRLGGGVRRRVHHTHRQRVLLDVVRLLPGHHVLRVRRPVPHHVHQLRDARPLSVRRCQVIGAPTVRRRGRGW